jgi:hypothetical protein
MTNREHPCSAVSLEECDVVKLLTNGNSRRVNFVTSGADVVCGTLGYETRRPEGRQGCAWRR